MMTFIVHTNLKKSAKMLDPKRLGNQRREALRLYSILILLEQLARVVSIEIPEKTVLYETKRQWVRQVMSHFKKPKHRPVWKIRPDSESPGSVILLPTDEAKSHPDYIRTGYIYHSIVPCWVGYRAGLAYYINTHIRVWKKLGYVNNMKFVEDEDKDDMPPWATSDSVILSHRASLGRKLPEYYVDWSSLEWTGYVWN